MKSVKKCVVGIMTTISLIVAFSGCGGKQTAIFKSDEKFTGYPIQTDVTLTYWESLNSLLAATEQNFGNSPLGKELVKRTGINVKYIHPPLGQEGEQLSILLSSDDLPDIIANNWYNFSGGPSKALREQIILPLNDVIEKAAPNLKKYLSEHPDVSKMVRLDDGTYYVFPFIRGDDLLKINQGLMIRQDWLNDLNLSMPETIDEWYMTLKQFKEKKGASAPLVYPKVNNMLESGAFIGAFGIVKNFFVEDGKVVYGPADIRYKDFLETFAKWYAEGLIDENIANVDAKGVAANILNNKSGVTYGYAGSGMGQYNSSLKEQNPSAVLVPAPYVSAKKGEMPLFGQLDPAYRDGNSVAITTSCENVELAARLLDYGYSEEGNMLFNFGIENESYTMVNDNPTYTDIIMKNPEQLTVSQAMARYIRANGSGPFVQRKEYVEQYYIQKEQKDALVVWGQTDAKNHVLPPITFTAEESSEIAKIMTDVKTFVDEKTTWFIMGKNDLSQFNDYLDTLKNYGIDRALEIYNAAYNRYQNRK